MALLFALALISASVGGRRGVLVRQDWFEQLVLYTLTVAPPSERKSPVSNRLKKPLRVFERYIRKQVADARRDLMAQITAAEQAAGKAGDDDAGKAARDKVAALKADLAELPDGVQLLADNVTPQKLAVEMAQQGGRMAILTPEGAELFGMLVTPSGQSAAAGGTSLGIYLKGFTGEPHTESRITRGSLHIEQPALTIGAMVQPAFMGALAGESVLQGVGIFPRFLYAQPESLVGYRKIDPDPIPSHVGDAFDQAITRLAERIYTGPHSTLTLTPAAYKRAMEFAAEIEVRLRPETGDLDPIAEWAGKLTGQTVRIAALMTLFENPDAVEVDEQAMTEAVGLAPWLISEARRVTDVTSGRNLLRDHPQAVVDTIRRRRLDIFTPRLIQRSLNKPWVNAATVRDAIAELEDLGYVRRRSPFIRSGMEANVYEVNPAVHHDSDV